MRPGRAVELRERFVGAQEGCHMSKTLWNTVLIDSDVGLLLFLELIDHSYNLIVGKLTT